MIYITQVIYIKEGKESAFLEFESHAIPLVEKYNGKLLHRLRPNKDTYVDGVEDMPYEIHFLSFPSQQDLDTFMKDDSRKDFIHLKKESISSALTVIGEKM